MDAVTEILIDRSHEASRLGRLVLLSLLLHGVILAAIAFLPSSWGHRDDNAAVMTIQLGGAEGPFQGRLQESERPVQEVAPPKAKPQPEAPPALAKPEMVEPLKTVKTPPRTAAKPAPEKTQAQLHGRTPTRGAEVKEGTARVQTGGSQTPFGGLATGGGGGGAAYTDIQNFCCPEYLLTMTRLIQTNWRANQGQDGSNQLRFTIHRDGRITDVSVEQSSVSQFLDLASQRAVVTTGQLPPLPAQFTGDHLTVHLVFQYRR
ncbi:MAG TPA: TonB family protein [Vicinamibacterales bacterium]|jgi:TonB family protein|nr:TonB family protein [Vicinamibacterales bacterium]